MVERGSSLCVTRQVLQSVVSDVIVYDNPCIESNEKRQMKAGVSSAEYEVTLCVASPGSSR